MRDSWNWAKGELSAHVSLIRDEPRIGATRVCRELRVAPIIENAPEFPMEEVADDLMLKMQGGLRGFVRDEELN